MSFLSRIAKRLGVGRARFLMGRDLDNNKYYEYPPLDGSTDARKTRRLIQYRIHKELGEHDQGNLPIQWLMWLRHTRRSAPTVEELLQDKERIEVTQHNARVLEQRDAERRLLLEEKAMEQTRSAQQMEASASRPANTPHSTSPRATVVPTAEVGDAGVEQEGHQQHRNVDMEVWEASRRRVDQQNSQQEDAFSRRARKRAELDEQDAERDAERQRARIAMNRSPLDAFDVTYEEEGQEGQRQGQSQLKPRFGRAVGPGEEWKPEEWSPAPTFRR